MKIKRRVYRNCDSFAIVHLRVRQAGAEGPDDPGKIEQLEQVAVFPTQRQAEDYIALLRQMREFPEGECFSVTARVHDARGKIVDHESDVFVG